VFLEPFKDAVAEGAVVELKLRLLAGKVPALQKYAHQKKLEDIEDELATHFGAALSAAEKETLRLCRQLRNKVLHSDFLAARDKLQELGVPTAPGGRLFLVCNSKPSCV
jgi:ABC-type siderophore export system fused ATPase/permease subunit